MSLHPSAHAQDRSLYSFHHPSQRIGLGGVGVALVAPYGGCCLVTGTLMEDNFMPVAMSRLLPFPGFCLGMQQRKMLHCPGILSAVSHLSLPRPTPSWLEDCCSPLGNDIY